ncbi:DNA utilization protein HofM [Citrobacter amalonaticus]|uniref:DNA utilization protein HofM n=1 Tax=Citrobacter amalonaticus TaxID=35703 RepID=A0A2S4RUN0_CITAM|nr:DNA utilization protein HofM [Citrobacter amalonaticus]POT55413.1 DNA utilization protein HofM [Citrobacter amalonaticus]POT73624.1 DNA utilization protein HofM [Citrobacter amalonaticus]POU63848.1 DNA utilization protein HofM [Citrobacter amalonaticus]POV03482.1 DNA utilization protein HofM [Citrobacter amalonaticus]
MAFRNWQIGLHIRQHEALAVAVVRGVSGWSLQRWWRMPLAEEIVKDGHIREPEQLADVLRPWSRELPLRHHIHLSFPAGRTRQKAFARPAMALREREQAAWLAGTMARELDMDPDALRFDYSEDALSSAFNVTAAQSKEVSTLLALAKTLKVKIAAITPDASALQRLLPFLPPGKQCLVWRGSTQWLWATCYAWGRKPDEDIASVAELAGVLSLPVSELTLCGPDGFDPWSAVSVRQPPFPPEGQAFAIALGLALGEMRG